MSTAKFENHINRATRTIEQEASRLVRKTAATIEADIKVDMASPKSGRTYPDGHIASAPGEAPAIDSGAHANAVQTANDGLLASEVGSDKEYAVFLEEGTPTLEPRPAWKRAEKRAQNTFRKNAQRIR